MANLSRDALVVRGGVMRDVVGYRQLLKDTLYTDAEAVISVQIDDARQGETHSQALMRLCDEADIRNGQVQESTLGRMMDAGFRVEPVVGDGEASTHHHVYFQEPVQDSQIQVFVDCFAQPVPNPLPLERRKRSR